MAKGLCSNKECLVVLTAENTHPSTLAKKAGHCKKCASEKRKREYREDPEKHKAISAKRRADNPEKLKAEKRRHYHKKRDYYIKQSAERKKTIKGRHVTLKYFLKKEEIPDTDPLWSFNFYSELIKDGQCHYCRGHLNDGGMGLDRMYNELKHSADNVVPCCHPCNLMTLDHLSYDEMMLLAPVLRQIRILRLLRSNQEN